jgi:acetyltransferase-like isoleucine patch superfamily enzyme
MTPRLATAATRPFRLSPLRTAAQARHRGRVTVGRGVRLTGGSCIELAPDGRLALGTMEFDFLDPRVRGRLTVRGRLIIDGRVTVASGCQWEIGPDAVARIGGGTYFSPSTQVVVSVGLTIGADCAIGWNSAFLDDDRHTTRDSEGAARDRCAPITLGDHVWVGSHAKVLKGVKLADGCIVAAGSTVTRSVLTPRTLVAGTPARPVREGVTWE